MKKISVDRIKSPPDVWEKYICPYCNHLLDEAVQAACGHRYCRSCAVELFDREENPYCLVVEDGEHFMIPDDIEFGSSKFFPDKFAQRDITKLMVACEFPNCPAVLKVKDLKDHMAEFKHTCEECVYCNMFIPAYKLSDHIFDCPEVEKGRLFLEIVLRHDLCGQLNETQEYVTEYRKNDVLWKSKGKKFKFENYYSALDGKEKTCPLSDVLWMDDLNHLLHKKQQHDLKAKWRDALAKVKRKRLPSMMYQMLSEAMNVLMTMNTQLYKYLFENLVGGDSADRSKPLFKKASTSGPNARIADDPTNENKKESIKPTMKLMCDLVIPNVSYCWDTIAYYLNFPVSKKREIEQRNNRDPYKCCVELMEDWLTSGRGTSPKTWSTLVSTLKQIDDLSSVSETIEERLLEKGLLA